MWLVLVSTVVIGFIAYKLFFRNSKNIFKEHGIREIDTSKFMSILDILLARKGMPEVDNYVYKAMGSEKYCGIHELGTPVILIKDMELIKKILIKDFDHFVDRRKFFAEADEVLQKSLPMLEGEEWKGVRASVSPTFTTGKIRRMMEFFNSVGKEWVESLSEKAKANPSPDGSVTIDVIKVINQYTVDVIASAVFGFNAGTIKNPDSPFAKYAESLADFSKLKLVKMAIIFGLPKLNKILKLKMMDPEAIGFFERILDQGLKKRLSGETTKCNDFLQLLVEAHNGKLKGEGNDELGSFEKDAHIELKGGEKKKQWLTEQTMNSQSLIFFFAGFGTTSNALTFAAYALAVHQDVQDKLRKEVGKIMKPDGNLDYDDLSTLVYLNMVVCEVLRRFPAGARLERSCVKDYKDNDSGLFVPKGTVVFVPSNALHYDEQYYDNPDKFDPEHFSPEKKAQRNPYAYMPFGIGPRNCIGMRFALVETKAAIAHLVHNFRIQTTKKTPVPITGLWAGFGYTAPKGLELKLTPLNK
ncbi:unnamed protein product [Orchesella dallaii]|uniref:Cytochrome P450 9e2 n=1 Tax=Orchesella dallaii TaxID=48710 RepID=A0ABP1Q242_9HEXA